MEGRTRSSFSYAEGTGSHVPVQQNFKDYPEFRVLDIDPDWADFLESVAPESPALCALKDEAQYHVKVGIRLHLSRTTYNAETAALAEIQKPRTVASAARKSLFQNLVLLNEPRFAVNLDERYSHIFDLEQIKCQNLRAHLLDMH